MPLRHVRIAVGTKGGVSSGCPRAIESNEANVMVSQQVDDSARNMLVNETLINVAALLQEEVGSRRVYGLEFGPLPLADEIIAARLAGQVALTRLRAQILGSFELTGTVQVECVRCLQPYAETVQTSFDEPFRQVVDVKSGAEIRASDQFDPDEDDYFVITENHEIDIREAIRQNVLLALPMRPDCGDDCPGPDTSALNTANRGDDDAPADGRFAALSALLDDQDATDR